MWYFTWILGLGFAAAFAAMNAMWLDSILARLKASLPSPMRRGFRSVLPARLA